MIPEAAAILVTIRQLVVLALILGLSIAGPVVSITGCPMIDPYLAPSQSPWPWHHWPFYLFYQTFLNINNKITKIVFKFI